MITSFDSRTR